jgi:hypothetical protein
LVYTTLESVKKFKPTPLKKNSVPIGGIDPLPTETMETVINLTELATAEQVVLQDQTFDQSCIKAVGQIETSFEEEQDIKALINSIENISEREKELYSLYYEVMTQYSQDMTDIVYLTNEYLKRIESSDEFTQKEKERIYFALTIVVNSAHYWQEFDL